MTTLNIRGRLVDMSQPLVMGILNVTPDSFYAHSRQQDDEAIRHRAAEIVAEGGTIIDIGAFSTRPDAHEVTEDEEMRRLAGALAVIRSAFPEVLLSVDTFRSGVARRCVQEFGVGIINDVSGGALDAQMFETVAELKVPYVLTHSGGLASAQAPGTSPSDAFLPAVARFFAERLQQLQELGVADVILDPGFGFGKTLEQNYELMHHLGDFVRLFPDNPLLVGVSRKSMIWKLLGITPDEALNGTTVLHTVALQSGAQILRVHDVKAAVETLNICQALKAQAQP